MARRAITVAAVTAVGVLGATTAQAAVAPAGEVAAAKSSCSGMAYAPPGSVWGKAAKSDTAVMGGEKQGYSAVVGGNNGAAGVQARSVDANGDRHWKSIGVAKSGGTISGTVAWHDYVDEPAIRAISLTGTGVNVTFEC